MKENKLMVFLLIFSIALNIGIIGYLFYDRTTHKEKEFAVNPPPPPQNTVTKNTVKKKRIPHHPFYNRRARLTREEREELKKFFQDTFQTLRPLIEKQRELKNKLMKTIENGDIAQTRKIVEEIHKNQAKIDIVFLEKASEEIKKYPKEKQRFITYLIMRFVSMNKRRF